MLKARRLAMLVAAGLALAGPLLHAPASEAAWLCKGAKSCDKLKKNCASGWLAGKDKQGTLYGECKKTF